MKVPATNDVIQEVDGKLEIPEIRVWCCPHRGGRKLKPNEDGSDYYKVFKSFAEAARFIKSSPQAESNPLIAFRGKELNLWAMVAK